MTCPRCAGPMFAHRDVVGPYASCIVCGAQVHLHPVTGQPEQPWGRIKSMPVPGTKPTPRQTAYNRPQGGPG